MSCAWAGCDACEDPAPKKAEPAASHSPVVAPVDAEAERGASADAGADIESEWVHFSRRDDVPLCVFKNDEARYKLLTLADVKTQALRPGGDLVFGVFGPDCANEECVKLVNLQCWVELEGKRIVVHSRYHGERRRDRVCSENCEPVTAGCPIPELARGSYEVSYGDRTYSLKIPSVMRSPCLRTD